tara:strand:+ start:2350 stop:4749 length:2400 start_codon:yes stop_codon:yes gene_type:complete
MKSNFFLILFLILFNYPLLAESLNIQSKNITIDKTKEITIFENDVIVKTEDNNTIKSDFAEYDRSKSFIKLKGNIEVTDYRGNIIKTNYAEYDEKKRIFKSLGDTSIETSEKYFLNGFDIIFDNKKKIINSEKKTKIIDKDNNKIFLDSFEFEIDNNIFKSVGLVKIEDKLNNVYEFSQVYIDTKKKEILGTDIKAFLNDESFKINKKNKPRVFANAIKINKNESMFGKSIFTICDYRKKDKCPPWTIQASKMLHDSKKKTIYYDNALIKVYDLPIFYFPKISHPDPTVDRRSGFLTPSISDSKNLGLGISIPYFWALNDDKNFTITNNLYFSENPLFLGEYHQAFKNSKFILDFGFTEGYKKSTSTKRPGGKSHIFAKFEKTFFGNDDSENNLEISIQDSFDDKYLKLYKIKSNLVDYNIDTLNSSIKFSHEKEDMFLGMNASIYETLKDSYEDKYEFIFPEITFDKNLFSNDDYGSLDLQTNIKVHNYDTNKLTNFMVNDLNWNFKETNFRSGIKGKILGNFKNINYEAKNVDPYKEDFTSEFYGALGYLASIDLQKIIGNESHLLTPKLLLRYSPGSMRKETDGYRLNPISAFNINRLENKNNFETGLSGTLGFDYKIEKANSELDFSVAQIINEKENKKMHSKTGLDEKLSDLVGSANYKINNRISLNYNFAIDQNYSDLNYNEVGTEINLNNLKIDFDYLQEKKHIGDQDYFKTKINLTKSDNGLFSFETKRNLVTNSAEFYNLSYEYINDCLRAGLIYRREFYTDSELEPENSLMFKITLTPFGNINSPSFSQ